MLCLHAARAASRAPQAAGASAVLESFWAVGGRGEACCAPRAPRAGRQGKEEEDERVCLFKGARGSVWGRRLRARGARGSVRGALGVALGEARAAGASLKGRGATPRFCTRGRQQDAAPQSVLHATRGLVAARALRRAGGGQRRRIWWRRWADGRRRLGRCAGSSGQGLNFVWSTRGARGAWLGAWQRHWFPGRGGAAADAAGAAAARAGRAAVPPA